MPNCDIIPDVGLSPNANTDPHQNLLPLTLFNPPLNPNYYSTLRLTLSLNQAEL